MTDVIYSQVFKGESKRPRRGEQRIPIIISAAGVVQQDRSSGKV